MKSFTHLKTLVEVDQFTAKHTLSFLYISQQNCSVCHGLLPQVERLLTRFPHIETAYIETNELPAIAGHFSIFTVPVLLLFVEGKEYIREARIVHMDLLEEKISTIYEHFYTD
ncbi:MAG TPA: thioredoxin family protein [Bacillota bacterium]|nr:thioredoxin family protein [Bacillota bacterium]